MPLALVALALAACGSGATRTDRAAQPPLEAPVSGPSAYVIVAAADIDRGWYVLEALDAELPAPQRAKIQTRGLVSGGSHDMMIRFAGECAADGGFVAAVRAVARRHDTRQVRCAPTLPGT